MPQNLDATYTLTELLACVASHLLEDQRTVFVGTGLPMIAAMLAQRTHAPNIVIIFEAGGVGPQPPVLPISVGDSRTFYKAVAASSMHDVMSAAQAGYIDFGFLGAAAIDMYGNLNTTVIGDWTQPVVRLPGSGGANDVGSFCWRTLIVMRNQSKKTFKKRLDFITTPGWRVGNNSRNQVGLPADCGPYRVISQLGVYGFDQKNRRMTILSLHPGVTLSEIQDNTEFELIQPVNIPATKPPTPEEQCLLHEIDPEGLVLGR